MSAIVDDLDDVEGLITVDHDGLLHAAALAGAQVRAVAEAQSESVLEPLNGLRPRAVAVVTGSSVIAARAASLVVAVLAARVDVPLVVGPALPGWIGPLDVVVLAGGDAGDPNLVDGAARAVRRRTELVLLAPVEGPLADAVRGDRVIDLSPRLRVDERFRFAGYVAALTAVLTGLTSVRLTPPPPDLALLADQLDAEAAADNPQRESFHNQAKLLALRVSGRSTVWTGDTPGSGMVAEHAASSFFAVAGVPVASADEPTALTMLHTVHASAPEAPDSIFYDPEFDDPPAGEPLRMFLVSTAAREWFAQQRIAGAGDADLVTERVADSSVEATGRRASYDEVLVDAPGDLAAYLLIALRAELAAVYLRLLNDTVGTPPRGVHG
ncbi:MAG: hypothetical protein QM658_14510 [Gordonia sp. (in: high G+C Gram-positive bacteria)]